MLLFVALHVWGTSCLDLPHAVLTSVFRLCDSAQLLPVTAASQVQLVCFLSLQRFLHAMCLLPNTGVQVFETLARKNADKVYGSFRCCPARYRQKVADEVRFHEHGHHFDTPRKTFGSVRIVSRHVSGDGTCRIAACAFVILPSA